MPEPLEQAAEAVADAADALQDAAEDAAQETEHVAEQPVVIIEQAAAPVADAVPATMAPHEHPEIAKSIEDLTGKIESLLNAPAPAAAQPVEDVANVATEPVASVVDPVAEPISNAVESAPRKTHVLFKKLWGSR